MKKSGWNPTRRNKRIGTPYQGFSKNNKLVIPEKYSDFTIFWERLNNPVAHSLFIDNHEITFLVEPTKPDYIHSCTIDDVKKILEHFPKRDVETVDLIVFRQPKRKEAILSSVWGRYVYYANGKIGDVRY